MHGRGWHDHEKPTESEGDLERARYRAVPEAESSGARTGMGARREGTRPSQTRERRKRSVPAGKGLAKRGVRGKPAGAPRGTHANARKG